jgi:lysyl-tRNA synthetase class 2
VDVDPDWELGKTLVALFEARVEKTLIAPTFVTGYPAEVSPLSRRSDRRPEYTDRFELFIAGREIANGFSELNDPEDQADRFLKQAEQQSIGDTEAMHFDADYIKALEYGLPPTAGEGIGIDRLVMLVTNSPSIRDVLLFPQMRSREE